MLWVTRMTVVPDLASTILASSTFNVSRVNSSSDPKGSSKSRISGSVMSTRHSATRCCMPPDSSRE